MSGLNGNEFRAIREELGLTQDQMAEVLCLYGKQAVCNIESGRRNPGDLMSALMQVFIELPERKSKELRDLLISISKKQSRSSSRRT